MYYPTRNSGIVTDFLSWLYKYQNGSYIDVLNCFGYTGHHQFFHFINFSLYKLIGINHFGWYFVFALFHGVNGYLVFLFSRKWFKRWQVDFSLAHFYVAIIFLISPYHVETLTWKACFHYIMSVGMTMSAFLFLIRYLETSSKRAFLLFHLLFLLSLFTLEINLASPFIFLLFIVLDHVILKEKALFNKLLKLFLPQVGLLVLYFLLNKISFGDWVGHYGADRHLDFSPSLIFGHGIQYFLKHFALLHFFPFGIKEDIYSALSQAKYIYPSLFLMLIAASYTLYNFKNLSHNLKIASTSVIMFFMGIFPIVNLFFMYVIQHENDRYSYYALPFFSICVVMLLGRLKYIPRYTILWLYIILNLVLLSTMINNAKLAGNGSKAMLQNFPCEEAQGKRVFFLGMPDNFNGIYMYRDFGEHTISFKESLDLLHRNQPCSEIDMYTVAQYNMQYASDIINAYFETDNRVRVFIGQNGTWFWKDGIGMSDYTTEHFKVENKGWYYLVTFFDLSDKPLLLYPHGGEWKSLSYKNSN